MGDGGSMTREELDTKLAALRLRSMELHKQLRSRFGPRLDDGKLMSTPAFYVWRKGVRAEYTAVNEEIARLREDVKHAPPPKPPKPKRKRRRGNGTGMVYGTPPKQAEPPRIAPGDGVDDWRDNH